MTVLGAQASGSPTTAPPATRTVASVAAPATEGDPQGQHRALRQPRREHRPTPPRRPGPRSDGVAGSRRAVSASAAATTSHSDPGGHAWHSNHGLMHSTMHRHAYGCRTGGAAREGGAMEPGEPDPSSHPHAISRAVRRCPPAAAVPRRLRLERRRGRRRHRSRPDDGHQHADTEPDRGADGRHLPGVRADRLHLRAHRQLLLHGRRRAGRGDRRRRRGGGRGLRHGPERWPGRRHPGGRSCGQDLLAHHQRRHREGQRHRGRPGRRRLAGRPGLPQQRLRRRRRSRSPTTRPATRSRTCEVS